MTGVFINTVARRVIMNPTATVLDTLREIQSEQLEISRHENISLSELQLAGIPVSSLFHTILNFRNRSPPKDNQEGNPPLDQGIFANDRDGGRDG